MYTTSNTTTNIASEVSIRAGSPQRPRLVGRVEAPPNIGAFPRPEAIGDIEQPDEWRDFVRDEGQCLVLVTGIGLDSNELGSAFESALGSLAHRGMVISARVAAGVRRTRS
jgi:hypothetical protein